MASVNVSATETYSLPTASTTVKGGIKIDGSTLAFNGSGQLYYTGSGSSGYTLPTASTSVLGGVKVDGTSVTINGSGVISATTSTTSLDTLTDVVITTPADGHMLNYNGTNWVNTNEVGVDTAAKSMIFQRETPISGLTNSTVQVALQIRKYLTDQATSYDKGGPAISFSVKGTDGAVKTNALIGSYNPTGDVSDFAIVTSIDGGATTSNYREVYAGSQNRTTINQGLLYVDKQNTKVGVNTTSPTYTLDVNGTLRVTGATTIGGTLGVTGTITGNVTGNLTGNVTGNVTGSSGSTTGNAATVTNGVYTTGSYANPTWITSLAYSKITGAPSSTALDGLSDVTISSAQKGKFLAYNGTAWVDNSYIEFDNTAYRPKFISNVSPSTVVFNSAAEFLKQIGTRSPQTDDGSAVLFGMIKTDNTTYLSNRIVSLYNATTPEYSSIKLQSSSSGFASGQTDLAEFAIDGSTIHSDLSVVGTLNAYSLGDADATSLSASSYVYAPTIQYRQRNVNPQRYLNQSGGTTFNTDYTLHVIFMAETTYWTLPVPGGTGSIGNGEQITIINANATRTNNVVITVNQAGWKGGSNGTITLTGKGQNVTLTFCNYNWYVTGDGRNDLGAAVNPS